MKPVDSQNPLTALVLINRVPWNELLLRGVRDWKDGGNSINHKGLILLQTSKSVDQLAVDDHGPQYGGRRRTYLTKADVESIPRGALVGAALFQCTEPDGHGQYEYWIDDARRFPQPIPFSQSGPVRFNRITITKAIEKQLRKVGMWRKALASSP